LFAPDPSASSRSRPRRRALLRLLAAAVLALATIAGLAAWRLERPVLEDADSVEVRIPAGSGARQVARLLIAGGLDFHDWEFIAAATIDRTSRHLRAGRYEFHRGQRLGEVLAELRRGDVLLEQLTLVEGSTFRELRARLDTNGDLRHDTLGWPDAKILAALGETRPVAEGLFAPDTYLFDPGTSDLELLRRALLSQRARLAAAWQERAPGLPYGDAYEALTMASIIEKETASPGDRGLVAAVFVNRQKIGMALQTDPTVIYGLGEKYEGRLHKRDLLADTPYNTYTRTGLPPTPISAPGMASLGAALHPQESHALYFVSRGDGTSEFSDTLAAHNRAVDRYLRALHAASQAATPTATPAAGKGP
jgi:UPF0755 protein